MYLNESMVKLFKEWESKVNSFSFRPKEETEKILACPNDAKFYHDLSVEWIHFHNEGRVWEDGRNAAAMRFIREISCIPEFQEEWFKVTEDPENYRNLEYFCSKAVNMHRTLMQTLSSFLFCVLAETCPAVNEKMTKEYDRRWWKMPLV